MARSPAPGFPALRPDLQLSFYHRLKELRERYLQEALKRTVESLEIAKLDRELAEYVSAAHLRRVASYAIRGEIFFPVPYLIGANPFLLGYYRLLYGLSQKEFYNKGPFGRFKRLEDGGTVPVELEGEIAALCRSLVQTAQILVDGIEDALSPLTVHDLQLLTIGPQLRGSENTRLGRGATKEVFSLIRQITGKYIKEESEAVIRLENDSGREVTIEFASDPDVAITEVLGTGRRPTVSIEVKGGRDTSNIHNRIGEAEKSHQKARNQGFFEFITIVRAAVDPETARRESPTTSHFFHLDRLLDTASEEHSQFRNLLGSVVGIRV